MQLLTVHAGTQKTPRHLRCGRIYMLMAMVLLNGCEIVLFFLEQVWEFFGFLGWYHLPSVCNALEPEFVIVHGICMHLPHLGMFIFHFAWDLLHVGVFTFHFVWYLLHFGMFTLHFAWDLLHVGVCTFHFAWDWPFGHVRLPFCMGLATFGHVHLPFCMGFPTSGRIHLPFCMGLAAFWHVHLPFCMGLATCAWDFLHVSMFTTPSCQPQGFWYILAWPPSLHHHVTPKLSREG